MSLRIVHHGIGDVTVKGRDGYGEVDLPLLPERERGGGVVASIRNGKGKAGIYSGADTAAVWTICQVLKSCCVTSPEQTRYISRLQLYGSAERNRWGGGHGAATV